MASTVYHTDYRNGTANGEFDVLGCVVRVVCGA